MWESNDKQKLRAQFSNPKFAVERVLPVFLFGFFAKKTEKKY